MNLETEGHLPCVSVVVVNHNGRRFLAKCFSSLMESVYSNFEVIMVDNASEDGSTDFVLRNFPSVKIERSDMNLGYAGGCNRGASIAKGDFIIFMNSDVEVSKGWLVPLTEVCSRPDVAVCGGKILIEKMRNRLYSAGGTLNLFSVPVDRGLFEIDNGQFEKLEDVAYVSGAAIMVYRKVFEMLGGFDSSFFAFCEEVNLCLRAWISGYRVVYTPSSVVYHVFGGSWGKPSPRRRFFGVRNMIHTLIKIFTLKNLLLLLPIYLIFRLVESIILALSGRSGYLASFVSAVSSSLSELNMILEERRKLQETRRVDDFTVLRFMVPLKHLKWLFRVAVFRSVL